MRRSHPVLGRGTVFKLTPAGTGYAESILYAFQGGNAGEFPRAGVIAGKSGALYGAAMEGGRSFAGVVFKLSPVRSGYVESVLYSFKGGTDGVFPASALFANKSGALFGTTVYGGGGTPGYGTVFKLTPTSTGYTESVLYRFQGGSEGKFPNTGMIAGDSGALYGVTPFGGSSACLGGCGVIFKLTPSRAGYVESTVYAFQGGSDGDGPSGLIARNGALYGTTSQGGNSGCGGPGCGTVFEFTPGP